MGKSKLGQLLDYFAGSPGGLSLPELSREMGISLGQIEGMVEFWVRKGRIRISPEEVDCGTCGKDLNCPFVMDGPRYYELVKDETRGGCQLQNPLRLDH